MTGGAGRLSKMLAAWNAMVGAVKDDHAMLRHYDSKYAPERVGAGPGLGQDFVTRVGFQMLVVYRAMRFCVEAGIPLAPQMLSRAIRHLYGSDIHWEARFDAGIVLVHGMGLAISRAAHVERGAILFQHVTLGLSFDSATRRAGAPTVGPDVHVGAGSTIVGPVTLGARSKVTANCFVRASVPPDSIVEAPSPSVSIRGGQRDGIPTKADA